MYRIRFASNEDSATIIDFQVKMAMESEGIDLDMETLGDGVVSVFRDPHKGKYFVVEDSDQVVASLLLTPEWSDWRNQWIQWIQSVYVMPDHRRKGIFRLMYEHIQALVKSDTESAGIRLYVDADNSNALEVYKSIGMNGEHYRVFEWMKS